MHTGHLAVVWNEPSAAYVVSGHLPDGATAGQEQDAIQALRGAALAMHAFDPIAVDRAQRPLPTATAVRCPKLRPQDPPAGATAGARQAALEQAPAVYRDTPLRDLRATRAVLARVRWRRARRLHPARMRPELQDRTVVVYLELPLRPALGGSSQGVVLVARFAGRYRIWARLR